MHASKGELLMKGSLHTDELMRAVTASSTGLRTARRISHVFVMDVPTYAETLIITDAAINIFPDLDAKRDIIQNAIDLFLDLGVGEPRVAILSAVETVTDQNPLDDRGGGAVQDGRARPDHRRGFGRTARLRQCHQTRRRRAIKGIRSAVAGRAQILVVPDLEAGNMLAKNLTFLAEADAAGLVLGARVPDRPYLACRFRAHAGWRLALSLYCLRTPASARRRERSDSHGHVLVLNAGSSSLKFQLFGIDGAPTLQRHRQRPVDGVGYHAAASRCRCRRRLDC